MTVAPLRTVQLILSKREQGKALKGANEFYGGKIRLNINERPKQQEK